MKQKKIEICGCEVELFYSAATENGFERLSGKLIDVFLPILAKNDEGKTVIAGMPPATNEDYMMLALAGIAAADSFNEREPVITSKDILYKATPAERTLLVDTIMELRNEWYEIPKIVNDAIEKEHEEEKATETEPDDNDDEEPKN